MNDLQVIRVSRKHLLLENQGNVEAEIIPIDAVQSIIEHNGEIR